MFQQRKGLRPGELLALLPEDFVLPEEQANPLLKDMVVVGLGLRAGTKLKRPQTVTVRVSEDPDIVEVLRRLKKHHHPRITMYTLFNVSISHVAQARGGKLRYRSKLVSPFATGGIRE